MSPAAVYGIALPDAGEAAPAPFKPTVRRKVLAEHAHRVRATGITGRWCDTADGAFGPKGNRGNLYQPLRRDRPMPIRVVMGVTVTPGSRWPGGNLSRSWCTPLGLGAAGPLCKHADKPQLSIGRAPWTP